MSAFWTRDWRDGALMAAARRVLAWYRHEFFALFPPGVAAWLVDRGDRELILRAGERDLRAVDARGAAMWSLTADEIRASSLDEAVTRRGLPRAAVRIGLEVDAAAFFVRRFDIPVAARGALSRLLIADIERKTPFRLDDIVHGHTIERHAGAPEKLRVSLWILRRDVIARAAEVAGLTIADISFLRPARAGAEDLPVIELGGATTAPRHFRSLALGLSAATALFAVIGVGATLWRQSVASEELEARIEEAARRAAHVRQVMDQASAESKLLTVLRKARRDGPLFADLWEETARILPDDAFLTDLRLGETKEEWTLDLVGFAQSAVGLPALFNKSPLLRETALTAPITPDPQEKKEAFSLQAKLEKKAAPK